MERSAHMRGFLSYLTRLARRTRKAVLGSVLRSLTTPSRVYAPGEATNIPALKRRLKIGDVLLVSGNARISYIVKLLTLSQWSHVVLYVGDRRDLLSEADRTEWTKRFGEQALRHLVVDADPVRGVYLCPVDEFVGLMVRQCRPQALSDEDLDRVVEHALRELGKTYDVKHIVRLLLFFIFPWEILPEAVRRFGRDFTLSESDTICSRVLSEAFLSVGYPIRPLEVIENRRTPHRRALGLASSVMHRGRSALRLFAGGRFRAAVERISDERYLEVLMKSPRHITPADYDLSRFFAVIKDTDDLAVDYRNVRVISTGEEIVRQSDSSPE